MIANQINLLSSLLERSSLQKTLKVVSYINCIDDNEDFFLRKVIKNIEENNREVVILKDKEDDDFLKSINIVDNGIKYILGRNLFNQDIFKSKFNQEILKTSSVINEQEFKNLDLLMIDSTSIFKDYMSKILKISDNIFFLVNTSEDSLNKIISFCKECDLSGQSIDVILIDSEKKYNLQNYLMNLKSKIKNVCNVEINIFSLILDESLNTELYKVGEKIYSDTVIKNSGKNANFFDFIINVLS